LPLEEQPALQAHLQKRTPKYRWVSVKAFLWKNCYENC